jgi:hypothetical protein
MVLARAIHLGLEPIPESGGGTGSGRGAALGALHHQLRSVPAGRASDRARSGRPLLGEEGMRARLAGAARQPEPVGLKGVGQASSRSSIRATSTKLEVWTLGVERAVRPPPKTAPHAGRSHAVSIGESWSWNQWCLGPASPKVSTQLGGFLRHLPCRARNRMNDAQISAARPSLIDASRLWAAAMSFARSLVGVLVKLLLASGAVVNEEPPPRARCLMSHAEPASTVSTRVEWSLLTAFFNFTHRQRPPDD